MRDPASLNKPSTREIGAANMIGSIPGTDVHWGLVFGIIAAIASYILIYHTVFGFAARVAGGNIRAAKIVGLGVSKLILTICFLAGSRRRPRRHGRGCRRSGPHQCQPRRRLWLYRHPGCFPGAAESARRDPGRDSAWRYQRRAAGCCSEGSACPTPRCRCLQGIIFVFVLASDALYGRIGFLKGKS